MSRPTRLSLQHVVGWGMGGYVATNFKLRKFGLSRLCAERGTILAVSHRSEEDVPVLASALYPRWSRAAAQGLPWPAFVTRDDLFLRGFLAGATPGLGVLARRLLWPLSLAGPLGSGLRCLPVREPTRMRVLELLRAAPQTPLDQLVPEGLVDALRERALSLGQPPPARGRDVLDGAYADLLWTIVERDQVPGAEEVWRSHLRAAVDDFRKVVELVRRGDPLIIFPEGEPSSDGLIGDVQGGLASLVRRGHPQRVQPIAIAHDPIAIAHDPLTRGRTRAYVAVGAPLAPEAGQIKQAVVDALRRLTPLTAGQIAAAAVLQSGGQAGLDDVRGSASDLVARAGSEGRPVEPALAGLLAEALTEAKRRGPDDPAVRFLARELESAHASTLNLPNASS